jgi:tetratricopeptide (TPR) repeat protein
LLGQAYLLTGENNLAKESFEHAIALYPGQVDARRSLAAMESQSGRHQQARSRLDDLLKQRPDDVAALDMLMMLDLVTKNWGEAERTLNRLRAVSKDSVSLSWRKDGYEAQQQFDKASAAYERATTRPTIQTRCCLW